MDEEVWAENKAFAELHGQVRDLQGELAASRRSTEHYKRRAWENKGRADAFREVALAREQSQARPARRLRAVGD